MITRRTILGAIPALPLITAPAFAAPPSPDERIAAAVAAIKAAMVEKYHGWSVTAANETIHALRPGPGGILIEGNLDSQVILIAAMRPKPYHEEIRWYRHT
ncbi:MAG: hypothetical protein ABS75_18545 [Pelagibacterium sp. SCN 63-23]|nr:MAG: hypothetical protein ABS75_18545 [Pelagibacterium sp. SCN 63-23]